MDRLEDVDHIFPRSRGGIDHPLNYQPLERSLNRSLGNNVVDKFLSLASLEVVRVHPFSGEVESFAMMPAKGRVAVSPSGKLWFAPVAYLNKTPIISWDLPASL